MTYLRPALCLIGSAQTVVLLANSNTTVPLMCRVSDPDIPDFSSDLVEQW
jgi:hypothetical protein